MSKEEKKRRTVDGRGAGLDDKHVFSTHTFINRTVYFSVRESTAFGKTHLQVEFFAYLRSELSAGAYM